MIKNGRTMSAAIKAGNAYQLNGPDGFNYFPPAATTSAEVREWARRFRLTTGDYTVERIIGGKIGARLVEHISNWRFERNTTGGKFYAVKEEKT